MNQNYLNFFISKSSCFPVQGKLGYCFCSFDFHSKVDNIDRENVNHAHHYNDNDDYDNFDFDYDEDDLIDRRSL